MLRRKIVILAAALMLLSACKSASLLEGLDERQANEVIAVMLHNNITATKRNAGKGSFSIEVAHDDLPQAIDLVRRYDLPSGVEVQVANAFPADAMVSTPLGERARLFSVIEQRLEHALAAMSGVRRAHVAVSYDMRTNGGSLSQKQGFDGMRLAAVIVHEPGIDDQVLLQSAKRFLRNTFAHLEYENISVVMSVAQPARALATTPERGSVASGWLPAAGGGALGIAALFLLIAAASRVAYRRSRVGTQGWLEEATRKLRPNDRASHGNP